MTLRLLHTSDLHLGKTFGGYRDEGRLTEARHQSIGRIAVAARDEGAVHVLVAGGLFEVVSPALSTWRQALTAMTEAPDLIW